MMDRKTSNSKRQITVGASGAQMEGLSHSPIQAAMDRLGDGGGGVVELSEGTFDIRDTLRLRSGVTLRGQGSSTVLRKCDAVRRAILVDLDWVTRRVTIDDSSGLEPGMGVTIGDDRWAHQGNEIVATIARKSGNTLEFDQVMRGPAMASRNGYVQTGFPLLWGAGVTNVGIERLVLDGNPARNFLHPDAWKLSGIYLDEVRQAVVRDCEVREIVGFGCFVLNCTDVALTGCRVTDCALEGVHVGGTRGFSLRYCRIEGNAAAMEHLPLPPPFRRGLGGGVVGRGGVYLCFLAIEGVYEDNEILNNNGPGIIIGYRDRDNLFVRNVIAGNRPAGIALGAQFRGDTYRTYGNVFSDCVIEDNGDEQEGFGVHISGDAHHTSLTRCTIRDTHPEEDRKVQRVGLHVAPEVQDVKVVECAIE